MIRINSFKGKYAWMSNFYNLKQPMLFEGVYYDNSEAAFQASKCTDINERKKFSKLNPSEAKALGRKVKMRPDWDTYRLECMHNVVVEKIKQNPWMADALLETGDAYLEEGNTWRDQFWGTVNGVGQNNLGKTLMTIREELRSGMIKLPE